MSRIDDGFGTIISFADDPSVQFFEKQISPPGLEGGGPNDTTTLRNTAWRTMSPKSLKSLAACTLEVSYDSVVYVDLLTMINNNQLITITFPNTTTLAFWGWLDSFIPGAIEEGTQPTATITIQPSNQNDSGVEVAPLHTTPSGVT